MTPDVNTILENLPYSIAGMSIENEDASYTIILNSRMTHERRTEAYEHEMRHIMNDDFEKYDVNEIEVEAHREEKRYEC